MGVMLTMLMIHTRFKVGFGFGGRRSEIGGIGGDGGIGVEEGGGGSQGFKKTPGEKARSRPIRVAEEKKTYKNRIM